MEFKDHFSGHATLYREARPDYPDALFDWLAQQVPDTECAWDCGCGNGQATLALAQRFQHVIGTDPSAAQIAATTAHERIQYRVEPAEQSSIADGSMNLITVAQALHWFDLERFYSEARRVLKPDGVLAIWTYAEGQVTPAIDAIKQYLYHDILDAYWPPERRLVEQGYKTLPFPFMEITPPGFEMIAHWNALQFLAYLRSWSATQRYTKTHGQDPILLVEKDILANWEDAEIERAIRWNLTLRVGR